MAKVEGRNCNCCLLWIEKVRVKNKTHELEIPRDKDEVYKWEIHECNGRAHNPGTMVGPLTPKSTHEVESLDRVTTTMALCHEEVDVLRKWPLPRYCRANCILETKTKVRSTAAKAPDPRTHPNIDEATTTPKSHTHLSHEWVRRTRDLEAMTAPPTPKPTHQVETLVRESPTIVIVSRREEDVALRQWTLSRYCCVTRQSMRCQPHPNHPPTHPTRKPPTLKSVFGMILLHQNKKRRETGKKCHTRNYDAQ
jgi:hypothetical protein